MANKELRRMNRTELIEIIYALQQNERALREENENLKKQLDEKILRLDKAGSIAEAALSLNHIFEDAQNAAQQYLDSLRAANGDSTETADTDPAESDHADDEETSDADSEDDSVNTQRKSDTI